MKINEKTYEITMSQFDYGIPIGFEADTEQYFAVGDTIVFCFKTEKIADKEFPIEQNGIENGKFRFNLAFTKEEANALFQKPLPKYAVIPFSIKRFNGEEYLETLENTNGEVVFKLVIMGTIKHE